MRYALFLFLAMYCSTMLGMKQSSPEIFSNSGFTLPVNIIQVIDYIEESSSPVSVSPASDLSQALASQCPFHFEDPSQYSVLVQEKVPHIDDDLTLITQQIRPLEVFMQSLSLLRETMHKETDMNAIKLRLKTEKNRAVFLTQEALCNLKGNRNSETIKNTKERFKERLVVEIASTLYELACIDKKYEKKTKAHTTWVMETFFSEKSNI